MLESSVQLWSSGDVIQVILYIPSGNILGAGQPPRDLPIPLSLGPPPLFSLFSSRQFLRLNFFVFFSPLPNNYSLILSIFFRFSFLPSTSALFPFILCYSLVTHQAYSGSLVCSPRNPACMCCSALHQHCPHHHQQPT